MGRDEEPAVYTARPPYTPEHVGQDDDPTDLEG